MSDQGVSHSSVQSSEVVGVVKWFNGSKGFGFVTPKDGSSDIFLHLRILKQSGFDVVSPGMTVRAEVAEGPRGLQAVSVIEVDKSTVECNNVHKNATIDPRSVKNCPIRQTLAITL